MTTNPILAAATYAQQLLQQTLGPAFNTPAVPSEPVAPLNSTSASVNFFYEQLQPSPFGPFQYLGGNVSLNGIPLQVENERFYTRWGPPVTSSNGQSQPDQTEANEAGDQQPKKKRKSRWETEENPSDTAIVPYDTPSTTLPLTTGALIPAFPKEITLPGGIKVILPTNITGEQLVLDPRVKQLNEELGEIMRKVVMNEFDIPPEGARSPSPEPIYDRNGIRTNTREIRYRERLVERRNLIVEDLIKLDPNFRPPPDYKPRKFQRRIPIPNMEYPGYNFIGLIIGPRGNTQKRMQKETNCKIAIRGKGSVKEGSNKDPKFDYGEDEELHVLITGLSQADVDKAAGMIEDLLQPMDEARNEQKRLQLRELALLNGTIKEEDMHLALVTRQNENDTGDLYQLPPEIKAKVEAQYARDVARMRPEEAGKQEADYQVFLRELGGAPPPEFMGEDRSGGPGLGAVKRTRPGDELPDECKVYVGNLTPLMNDRMLSSTFATFGNVLSAVVFSERGYGFVNFTDADAAKSAAMAMNGKVLDGRNLIVRLRSERPQGSAPPGQYQVPNDAKLYVGGLPENMGEAELRQMFEQYGPVYEIKVMIDRATGQRKGYAFLTMGSSGIAQAAIRALDGHKVQGRTIVVRIAGIKPDSGDQTRNQGLSGPPPPMQPPPRGAMPGPPPMQSYPPPGMGGLGPNPPFPMPAPGAPQPHGSMPSYLQPPPGMMPPGHMQSQPQGTMPPPQGGPMSAPQYYAPPPRPGFPPAYAPPPGSVPSQYPGPQGPSSFPPPYAGPPPGSAPPPFGYYPPPGHQPGPQPQMYAPPPGAQQGQGAGPPSGYYPPPQTMPQGSGPLMGAPPPGGAPPATTSLPSLPPEQKVQSEYERFMSEMKASFS